MIVKHVHRAKSLGSSPTGGNGGFAGILLGWALLIVGVAGLVTYLENMGKAEQRRIEDRVARMRPAWRSLELAIRNEIALGEEALKASRRTEALDHFRRAQAAIERARRLVDPADPATGELYRNHVGEADRTSGEIDLVTKVQLNLAQLEKSLPGQRREGVDAEVQVRADPSIKAGPARSPRRLSSPARLDVGFDDVNQTNVVR